MLVHTCVLNLSSFILARVIKIQLFRYRMFNLVFSGMYKSYERRVCNKNSGQCPFIPENFKIFSILPCQTSVESVFKEGSSGRN